MTSGALYLSSSDKKYDHTHDRREVRLPYSLRQSSSSQRDSKQAHDQADQQIFERLRHHAYGNTEEFSGKCIKRKAWTKAVEDILESSEVQSLLDRMDGTSNAGSHHKVAILFQGFFGSLIEHTIRQPVTNWYYRITMSSLRIKYCWGAKRHLRRLELSKWEWPPHNGTKERMCIW